MDIRTTFERKKIPMMNVRMIMVVSELSLILKSVMREFFRVHKRFSKRLFTLFHTIVVTTWLDLRAY
jgi:hypothetical protein